MPEVVTGSSHNAPRRGDASAGSDPPGSLVAFPRARPSDNLPLQLSSFVGREQEVAEVKRLLVAGQRLLTLTGPGGCGKTRLALRVANERVESFEDGVWLVELAPLSDPDLVPQAVASVLDVREQPGRPLAETLVEALRSKRPLLVLDNCEHLIEATARFAEVMLTSCPHLRILATSREALGVSGEANWPVPSLSVPDPGDLPAVETLGHYEAPRLFLERARSRLPGFVPTPENARAVAQVCRTLDGIPLAIELAAARVGVLSVEQIAARLEDCLKLLTGGSRMAAPRQQTLRATLAWGYDLLSGSEGRLFGRLSMFAGGWTLEAAEAVGAGGSIERDDVLDLLSHLVDKSIVVSEATGGSASELRYRMLEPVCQYGLERLEASGETDAVRRRHAAWFLALAERAEPHLKGHQQVAWMERLEMEHDNLRAAMRWLLEESEIETAVQLAWLLWFFWRAHGYQGEGYRYTGEVLEKGGALPTGVRAKALCVGGLMSYGLESIERTKQLWEESTALFRQTEERFGLALALGGMGLTTMQQGDVERANAFLEEALEIYRGIGNKWGISAVVSHLGIIPLGRGDHEQAARYFEEALAISREIGDRLIGSISLYNLAREESRIQGDHERAAQLYVEGLGLAVEMGDKANAAYCLEGLAGLIGERGEPKRAARLFGASEALLEAVGAPRYVQAQDQALVEAAVDTLRARLGEEAFEAAWAEGRAMALEQAVEYALAEPATPREEGADSSRAEAAPAETKARPELRILALGASRVEREGRALTSSEWGYAKPKELLFYLLSHPSRTKEQIGLALWPDASSSQLRGSFHEALRRLRKALGAPRWISFADGRYAFDRSLGYFFDVEAFESKLAEARRVEAGEPERAILYLEEAMELYQGDFLEDLAVAGEWALIRQEELLREYLEGLLTLGRLFFACGRYAEASEAYRKVIAHDGYLEAAHRELMRCHAALGERGRALEHYRGLVESLSEEIGTQPAPETRALYESLRQGKDV